MADQTPGAAEAPAASGAELSVFDQARAEISGATTDSTPTPPAPDSSAAPTQADSDDDTPDDDPAQAPADDKQPLSRRQRGEAWREQVRAEERAKIEAEYAAAQQAEADRRAAEQARQTAEQERQQAEEQFNALIAGAKTGDYDSSVKLAELIESNRAAAEIRTMAISQGAEQGRNEVLSQLAQDFASIAIDGLDTTQLRSAPSIADLVQRTHALTRAPLDAKISDLEAKVAALEAENTGLKGRVAGRSPSPEPANGGRPGAFGEPGKDASMRDYYEHAKRQLGVA